jgi:hypothetical protein
LPTGATVVPKNEDGKRVIARMRVSDNIAVEPPKKMFSLTFEKVVLMPIFCNALECPLKE